jgi:hypothetical protein
LWQNASALIVRCVVVFRVCRPSPRSTRQAYAPLRGELDALKAEYRRQLGQVGGALFARYGA